MRALVGDIGLSYRIFTNTTSTQLLYVLCSIYATPMVHIFRVIYGDSYFRKGHAGDRF